jgi:hypothetical protein
MNQSAGAFNGSNKMFGSSVTINKPETFVLAVLRRFRHTVAIPLALVLYAAMVPAAAATSWTFDWAALGWTAGSLGPRVYSNVAGSGYDIRVRMAITGGAFVGGSPVLNNSASTPAVNEMTIQVNFTNITTANATVLIEFCASGANATTCTPKPAAMNGLTIKDIDRGGTGGTCGNYQDVVRMTAVPAGGGAAINPAFISQFNVTAPTTPSWIPNPPTAGTSTISADPASANSLCLTQSDPHSWATFNFATTLNNSVLVTYLPGDGGGLADPSQQFIWLSNFVFSDSAVVTQAVVSGVRAYMDGGRPVVEWETASEIGTAGFNVFRLDPATGSEVRLNNHLLPSLVGSTAGGIYRHTDAGIASGGTYRYRIEEVEARGAVRSYGPFSVQVAAASQSLGAAAADKRSALAAQPPASKRADGFARSAHAPTGRLAEEPLATLQLKAGKAPSANTALRILVDHDALYSVEASQIASALGVPLQQARTWIGQGQMRLQQKGQQVSWKAATTNDRLYFYGQAVQGTDSVHTRHNVYWLDQANGQTMTVVNGKLPTGAAGTQPFRSRLHVEENVLPAAFLATDPDADFFYWNYVVADDPAEGTRTFPVTTPGVIRSGTATLSVSLQGATDLAPGNDHHARVLINGTEVGSAVWNGITPHTLTASFNASLLAADGNNIVGVTGSLDPGVPLSVFWVNGFDVDFPRGYQADNDQLRLRSGGNAVLKVGGFGSSSVAVLDISDPRKPRWLASTSVTAAAAGYAVSFVPANANTDYVAAVAKAPFAVDGDTPSSTLKTTNNDANYLVLTPASLRAGADALAAYRSGRVVELQDIYDEFNYGIANPNAIRDFLSYANQNWRARPRYVALVGKGTFDPNDYMGFGTNRLPVLMSPTPQGLFASDNRYVDFDNTGTPNIAIGRISALVSADVTQYVSKLIAYNSAGRGSAAQALIVADNSEPGADFAGDSTAVAQALQARGFTTTPVFLDQMSAAAARQQIIGSLNSAAGAGLFHFAGHGGVNIMADEDMFNNGDVGQLTNGSRLTVFLAFSCALGDGTFPGFDSLAETLLWRPGGGAVAAFAPTGLSENSQAHILDLSMVKAMVGARASPTLGDAAVAAVADLAKQGGQRYMLEKYSVTGDPALKLHP